MITRISRVHGDEDGAGGVQFDLGPLKQKDAGPRIDPSLDGQDLLGHHGQHLKVDTVELIKAGPCSTRGQPLEKLAQGNVVQTVRAVKHYTLDERWGERSMDMGALYTATRYM